ncbi:MAG: hypothetical protein LBQ34_07560 [Alphaproteobacteria bacterium]|jgi:hypothetical protein|nr:hypothetical protein [Alphaproteobacteria bacterium]
MTKLLGVDILKGYLGCYGAKIIGFSENDISKKEGSVILDNTMLYNTMGA